MQRLRKGTMKEATRALAGLVLAGALVAAGCASDGPERIGQVRQAVFGNCTVDSFLQSEGSPSTVGLPVTFTASATCGGGDAEYRFWHGSPSGNWTVVQEYGSPNGGSYEWITTNEPNGVHIFEVWVRVQGSQDPYEMYATLSHELTGGVGDCASVDLVADPPTSSAVPDQVSFTATGHCSTGTPLFQFWLGNAEGGWTMVQDWDPNDTYLWTTSNLASGTYYVEVWVRGNGQASMQGYADLPHTLTGGVGGQCESVTSAFSPAGSAHPRRDAVWVYADTTQCSRGTPLYQFWVGNSANSWTMVRDYSADPTYYWDVASWPLDTYTWEIWVKASGTTPPDGYQAYSPNQNHTIIDWCFGVSTISSEGVSSPRGTPVTFTATADCTGPVEYAFYLGDPDNNYTLVKNWSTDNFWDWTDNTQAMLGRYNIEVWVRTPLSGNPYEAYFDLAHDLIP
jgi:hypothetical protein